MGAADRALASRPRQVATESHPSDGAIVRCASLKSNMGHLEAAAAAAGLAALVTGPLLAAVVAVNAQLRGSATRPRLCPLRTRPRLCPSVLFPTATIARAQVERPSVVDRIVDTVVVPDARRGGGANGRGL